MNRKTLFAFVVVTLSLATAASPTAQTNSQPALTAAPVSIPFELVARHIVLKVKIDNSRPLSFVFDTGDKVAIVDAEVAKELGLDLQGQIRVGGAGKDRKSTRLNSSHIQKSRMPSSA